MTLSPLLPLWLLVPILAILLAYVATQLVRSGSRQLSLNWALRTLMVLLLVVVSLRPAIGSATPATTTATGGLEVYFVVDTTSSMAAEDFGDGIRLDGVKADIAAMVDGLGGAEFSLMSFDSSAVQRVPLTTDASALKSAASVLTQEVTVYSAGSSIDAGLELLTRTLTEAEEAEPDRPRVVYYLGDGEQTRDTEPASFEEIAPLISGGAVLGYGTEDGGRMMDFDGYADEQSQPTYIQDYSTDPVGDAISRLDPQNLQSIADQLGVAYSVRSPGAPIEPLIAGLDVPDAVNESETADPPLELYWLFAIPIGLILVRELFVVRAGLRELRGQGRPTS